MYSFFYVYLWESQWGHWIVHINGLESLKDKIRSWGWGTPKPCWHRGYFLVHPIA